MLRRDKWHLTGAELERLREAELALAAAEDLDVAAQGLAERAVELLGAGSAVVLIESVDRTVRAAAGDQSAPQVYGSGSRMRLIDDDGVPCGSIAVSARADGRPYGQRHERILDALAERVSSTIRQLSLLDQVRAERTRLADLIGSTSDGILSVGPDLAVTAWNPAMARITGIDASRAVGRHVNESFRPVDSADRNVSLRMLADPKGPQGAVVRIRAAGAYDGEDRWLSCSSAPLSDGGFVVIARDETERKKLQDDKDGWVAQVSHELRTPLTPIKGFLQTLSTRGAEMSDGQRTGAYEIMLRETARLEHLVEALLQTTRFDAGGVPVDLVRVDWADLVAEQVEAVTAGTLGAVEISGSDDLPAVVTDTDLAVSILTNLVSNAVKYGASDAGIQIEMSASRRGGVGVVTTRVIDHGPGIPASDRERIFDKFTRLGSHLTRAQQGVGLGLHIVRRSLDLVGGGIEVTETPGGGATFSFWLPVTDPAEAETV